MAVPAVVETVFPQSRQASDAFIRDGMSPVELEKLSELVLQEQPDRVLEIGMANGTSSVVISDALRKIGRGHLTSIDPYQSLPIPKGYNRAGAAAVATLTSQHRLLEQHDYLALPKLIQAREWFDFIFIDGYHSFDLTLLDLFYADKLLITGGLLLCHDSSSPAVYKALRWLETNKPYTRLSPSLYTAGFPVSKKIWARLFCQAERRTRQTQWQMLVAYRKQASHQMTEHVLEDF